MAVPASTVLLVLATAFVIRIVPSNALKCSLREGQYDCTYMHMFTETYCVQICNGFHPECVLLCIVYVLLVEHSYILIR